MIIKKIQIIRTWNTGIIWVYNLYVKMELKYYEHILKNPNPGFKISQALFLIKCKTRFVKQFNFIILEVYTG